MNTLKQLQDFLIAIVDLTMSFVNLALFLVGTFYTLRYLVYGLLFDHQATMLMLMEKPSTLMVIIIVVTFLRIPNNGRPIKKPNGAVQQAPRGQE